MAYEPIDDPYRRRGYGSPPYEESAFKRMLSNLRYAGVGLGAVPPGANFGQAFLAAAGRSTAAIQQADQAAMRYALAQEEQRRRQEEDSINRMRVEAEIERMRRPEPPEKPEKDPRPWQYLPQFWDYPGAEALRKKDEYLKVDTEKPAGPKLGDLNTMVDNFRADKDVQNFTVVRDNFRRINSSSRLGTGQGDLATIFSFMRVLDPESVVRETEFKNASEAVGVLQRVYNVPRRWVQGDRLTAEGRAGFRQAAKQLYETQKRTYESKVNLYKRQAKKYGVDPEDVIPVYDEGDTSNNADLIYNPETGELEPAR